MPVEPAVSAKAKIKPSDSEDDPLANLSEGKDLEADSFEELDAIKAGFRRRMKQEGDRFRRATDLRFWTAVCFESTEQRNAFLDAVGFPDDGQYIDGVQLAEKLGIDLS